MVVVDVVAVIQVKVAETSRVVRHLYIKEHNVTDTHPCKPSGRTLLVLNVPPYVTEVNCVLPTTFIFQWQFLSCVSALAPASMTLSDL